jgi:hypothetical protein
MANAIATGEFTCEVILQRIRVPELVREERGGVIYLVNRDYELAYETILCFTSGATLPVTAELAGELSQQGVSGMPKGNPCE